MLIAARGNSWPLMTALDRGTTQAEPSTVQLAKKVGSYSPGLVDFAIRLVIGSLNLPNSQVLFFGEIQNYRIVINPANHKGF